MSPQQEDHGRDSLEDESEPERTLQAKPEPAEPGHGSGLDEGGEGTLVSPASAPVPAQRPSDDAPLDDLGAGGTVVAPHRDPGQSPTRDEAQEQAAPRPKPVPARRPGDTDSTGITTKPLPTDAPAIPDVTLTGVLGQGGQGAVYKGHQDYLDRDVAVKVLGTGGDEFEQRFRREAKILAGLSHPSIVACHHAGVTPDGCCYMVMELIEGPDLSVWVKEQGPVAPIDALAVVRDIARALEHGYEASIIHRDVKPQNVLLQPTGEGRFPFRAKLADLGLARATSEESDMPTLTAQGAVMGTPSTMAPEQFDDPDSVDFRADIYGLGCVLYCALVGTLPFSGRTFAQVFKQKATGPLPDPSKERAEVTRRVARLVGKMLARERQDRHASYSELCAELEAEIEVLRGPDKPGAARAGGFNLRRAGLVTGLVALALVAFKVLKPSEDEAPGSGEDGIAATLAGAAGDQDGTGAGAGEPGGTAADTEAASSAAEQESADPSAEEARSRAEFAAMLPAIGEALEAGVSEPLFAWQTFDQLLEGWQRDQNPGLWISDVAGELRAFASARRTEARRSLPAGRWGLTGQLRCSTGYNSDLLEATHCGLRVVFEDRCSLLITARPTDESAEPDQALTWCFESWTDSSWVPLAGAYSGELQATWEPPTRFALRLSAGGVDARLGDEEIRCPGGLGAPRALVLLADHAAAEWYELELEGLE